MREQNVWTSYATAMELRVEGDRLIAAAIADAFRGLWRRITHSAQAILHGSRQRPHLPPL